MRYLAILLVIGVTVGVTLSAPVAESRIQSTQELQNALKKELQEKLTEQKEDQVATNQEDENVLAQVLLRRERVESEAKRRVREQFNNLFSSGPIYIDARDKNGHSVHTKPWINFIKKMVASSSG